MNLKINKSFEKAVDTLDLDSILLLISILSQKAYVLNQEKDKPQSPIIAKPTKLII